MVHWLISIGVGIATLLSASFYAWRRNRVLHAKFNALVSGLEAMTRENPGAERIEKEPAHLLTRETYQQRRKQRLKKTVCLCVLLPVIAFLLVLCIVHVFVGRTHAFLGLYPIPLLVAGALMSGVYLVENGTVDTLPSSLGSEAELWQGAILLSVPKGGRLDIVLHSLNPGLLSEQWFIKGLGWLQRENEAKIRIVAGEPDPQWMNGRQRKRWEELVLKEIIRYELLNSVRIAPRKPQLRFVVTDNLVRVEENNIRFYDVSRIKRLQVRFEDLWRNSRPASNLPHFQPLETD